MAGYPGFVLGQTGSVLGGTLTFATSATASSDVGTYATTPGGSTPSNDAPTFAAGMLTITPAQLTVTADDKSKMYGAALPAFTAGYRVTVVGQPTTLLGWPLPFATSAASRPDVGARPTTPRCSATRD